MSPSCTQANIWPDFLVLDVWLSCTQLQALNWASKAGLRHNPRHNCPGEGSIFPESLGFSLGVGVSADKGSQVSQRKGNFESPWGYAPRGVGLLG